MWNLPIFPWISANRNPQSACIVSRNGFAIFVTTSTFFFLFFFYGIICHGTHGECFKVYSLTSSVINYIIRWHMPIIECIQ